MSAGSGCGKCLAPLWRVFPHLALCGTLVAYAVLGALIFQRIEGGNKPSKIQEDYREFLGEIVDIVRNHSRKFPHKFFKDFILFYYLDFKFLC